MTGSRLFLQYAFAFMVPLVATLWLTPVAGWVANRFGILSHPSEERFHSTVTPYLGGLAVAIGLAIIGAFAARASDQLMTILLCGLALMLLGLIDDHRGVGPLGKLLVEVAAGLALWFAGVGAGLFGIEILDAAFTVLWVVAVTNSLNLVDNMDGLAAGVTTIAAITYFVIAASQGDYLVGSFALALAGASLGFLRHNFPPARIFLGDAGSLMLGFLLAALALKLDLVGGSGLVRGVIPILILGVPIFDTLLVIIARLRGRRPVFLGGTDHSSHRLTELGLTGRGVALATYGAQTCMCGIALFVVHAGNVAATATLVAMGIAGITVLARFLAMSVGQPSPEPAPSEDP